jgi:hypothetical protein
MSFRSRLRQWLTVTAIGSICFWLSGCQFDPWADGFLKKPPAESDLVGTYRIDADTLSRRISFPTSASTLPIGKDAEISLTADHNVQFFRVPEFDYVTMKSCVISGAGTWRLGRNDSYVVVDVQIQRPDYRPSIDGCGAAYGEELMLYGKKPPFKLHITIGDPDSGDALQFEKVR